MLLSWSRDRDQGLIQNPSGLGVFKDLSDEGGLSCITP